MAFRTLLIGNQPKICDDKSRVNLRVTRNRADKGKASPEDVENAIRETIGWTVDDQLACGFDCITDGRIRWDDPVTPFAAAHEGFAVGGLIRYFDNNVYYRRPSITGPIRFARSAVVDDFRLARTRSSRPLVPSVCGPFSLAKFCTNDHYTDPQALYADCAALVNMELAALREAGAEWVQLDEPFVGFCPDEIDAAIAAISTAVQRCGLKVFVYSYFAPLTSVIHRLWTLPVAAIGADCVTVPGNCELLLTGPETMGRGFGIVDARSTRLESRAALQDLLGGIRDAGAARWPVCYITPSAGLEFLPYKNALVKMKLLVESVGSVREQAANLTETGVRDA